MAAKAEKAKRVRGPVWKTRDGRVIPIRDMTDDHLRNTILFLQRAHARYVADILANPPNFNGEMAQYYAEQEWLETASSKPEDLFPIYEELYLESVFRNEERRKKAGV